jgi:hypothetical protein
MLITFFLKEKDTPGRWNVPKKSTRKVFFLFFCLDAKETNDQGKPGCSARFSSPAHPAKADRCFCKEGVAILQGNLGTLHFDFISGFDAVPSYQQPIYFLNSS